MSVDGRPVIDFIDFQFHAQSESVALEVARGDQVDLHELDLEGDEYWGITFADATFDGVRICENACPFCFIKQIPKGMRQLALCHGRRLPLLDALWQLRDADEPYRGRLGSHRGATHRPAARLGACDQPGSASGAGRQPQGRQRILDDLARLERPASTFTPSSFSAPASMTVDELDRSLSDLNQFGAAPFDCGCAGRADALWAERQSKQLRNSREPACEPVLGKQIEVRRYEPWAAEPSSSNPRLGSARFRVERGETFFYLGDEFYLMTGREVPPVAL